ESVVVIMGSGGQAALEAVEALSEKGRKIGLVRVRLYRPFDSSALIESLPATVRRIAVLDRTKEPGATGEPLYQDVLCAMAEHMAQGQPKFAAMPRIVGGRYGLSSKEFTPAMVKAVYDRLEAGDLRHSFTVGITDDVTHTSIDVDASFTVSAPETVRAMFFGLGSDGTVGS
ncbi:MAG: pyruvate:ferredoxin (flavodoxin) oxidoreductase, partial [Anaerolineales bacterium]|nr:pyruvate:ferredoxin (flavodoxin) oxidoreductase [Anaerolineales bacterium]